MNFSHVNFTSINYTIEKIIINHIGIGELDELIGKIIYYDSVPIRIKIIILFESLLKVQLIAGLKGYIINNDIRYINMILGV